MHVLRSCLQFAPLALTCALTLQTQLWWQTTNLSLVLLPYSLWLVLIFGWLVQSVKAQKSGVRLSRKMAVLPACLAVFFVSRFTHAPLRFLFWAHKSAIERPLNRPPLQRQLVSIAPRIGSLPSASNR